MKRRTSVEVQKLAGEAHALMAGGMGHDAAADKVGLARSVLHRALKKLKANGQSGKIDIRSLPPRPKKKQGGQRGKKTVNLNSMTSVAGRIGAIDKRLAKFDSLREERKELTAHLMKLLKRSA